MPGEARGVVPTPRWLKRTWKQDWYEGQTINLSIGQGYLAVTPLQLAVAYAALANGGKVVQPHLARALAGKRLDYPPQRRVRMTSLDAIHEGLYEASHSAGGTSTSIFGNFYPAVSGKTGTAETPYGSDHSWYASWAPSDNPRFVVVVLIEHGGFGAQAAAPAAREIYHAIFHGPKGKKTGGKAAPRVTP
jgi:penicillin-binding protein 2